MTEKVTESPIKKNRNPMVLVCGILFIASSIGIFMYGGDRSVGDCVGMSLIPLLFLVGTVHFWRKSD